MVQPLSLDLRVRVVAAVAHGMSRRQAAQRFGVSAASAVRWCQLSCKQGDAKPRRQGGDRHSHRIEAHAYFILGLVAETPDITLAEIRDHLAEIGESVVVSTVWRFFDRRNITFKKRPRMRASRIARTS